MKKITYNFKVNGLNKKGKESWSYVTTISQAMEIRNHAQNNGISSNIYENISGKWCLYPF